MKISIIAAVAANRAIGLDNKLIYWLPDDLKRFKALTTGHTIVMGRNTYESLPKGALPNRRNPYGKPTARLRVLQLSRGSPVPLLFRRGSLHHRRSPCLYPGHCHSRPPLPHRSVRHPRGSRLFLPRLQPGMAGAVARASYSRRAPQPRFRLCRLCQISLIHTFFMIE